MATAALQEVIDQFSEAFARFFTGEISAQQLSDITGLGPEELAYCLPDYVDQVNTVAKQYGGDNVVNVPHPPPAPPHGSDPTVYNTYLSQVQNTYVHDESITQVINNFGNGDVNAQIATDGGVNIGPGSTLDDSGIITGSPSAPVAIGTDGDVNQIDDINAGGVGPGGQGNLGVNQGDGTLQQANQANEVDITKIGDNTGGAGGVGGAATSGAATGGAGAGVGGTSSADGGAGGDAGAAAAAGGGGGLLGLGGGGAAAAGAAGGDGGDGGFSDSSGTGVGGAASSGNASGGDADGGDAGDDIDADGGDINF